MFVWVHACLIFMKALSKPEQRRIVFPNLGPFWGHCEPRCCEFLLKLRNVYIFQPIARFQRGLTLACRALAAMREWIFSSLHSLGQIQKHSRGDRLPALFLISESSAHGGGELSLSTICLVLSCCMNCKNRSALGEILLRSKIFNWFSF